MKIVVLAGGLSPERNVSLSSGAMVCEALRSKGHQVALVDLFFGMEGTDQTVDPFQAPIPQAFKRVSPQAPDLEQVRASRSDRSPSLIGPGVLELCAGADVVYLALHGACGEDGRIQAALDLLGVPYTGSNCLSSAIAMDKDMTKRLVADQVRRGLEESVRLGGRTVLEQYIKGREIQVAVLNGRALPSIEIIPQADFYDYANKYQPGAAREVCPAEIPPEWEKAVGEAALAVFRTIGLSVYARADFIVTEDGTPYFLEINTLPGMTPTSLVPQEAAAVGIGYADLCQTIVEASLEARREGV